jgi:pimeloyl-ACP methyl ester carboxylesterase
VLVHGSVGDYRQWDPIAGQLRGEYRLTAVSRRFHWPQASAPTAGAYTYEAHRDDLIRYLRMRAAPVHLVGHSYGAGVVLLAALAEPALLRSVVLIEPAFNSLLPDDAAGLDEELASRDAMAASVRSLAASGQHDAATRRLIDWVQGGPGTFALLPGWVQAAMRDNAITAGATLAHRAPEVTCAELRQCHVPALVVTGEVTRPYYRLIASRAAACLAEAASASLTGAAHMTIVERPLEAAIVLSGFLARR